MMHSIPLLHQPIGSAQRIALGLLVAVLLCCTPTKSTAQDIPDSKGHEFWLTFLPNIHANDYDDSLHIFITADKATQGWIRWNNINGIAFSRSFKIDQPNQIFHFKVEAALNELVGYNNTGVSLPTDQNGTEAPQVFHITADDEITVYGLNQAQYTSDAFLALPSDALGTDYIAIAYNSDDNKGTQSTPSQFAIVATEDNTTVTIVPRASTTVGGTAPQTVQLSRGMAYLVQAQRLGQQSDLTGSTIEADKPVAVFAGHQRATIPIAEPSLTSRDHLVEQLIPTARWGRSAFAVPYMPSPNEAQDGTDLYRVIAAYDSTKIFIDGVLAATLKSGNFIERPLTSPHIITASEQIMVAQYKKTSGDQSSGIDPSQIADPFMMLIPPSEQFLSSYSFINAQARQKDFNNQELESFVRQYITVVIPNSYTSSVVIDGIKRTDLNFTPINSTIYSYAHVAMTDGPHTITADTTFGLYVYGYGPANSYGYIGGLQMRVLAHDRKPPVALGRDSCYTMSGIVYDTLSNDSGINTVQAPDSLRSNVSLSIAPFSPYADSVSFKAALVNPYNDGLFTLVSVDSAGQKSQKEFVLSGFTVHIDPSIRTDDVVFRTRFQLVDTRVCETLILVNYGRTVQVIDTLLFRRNIPNLSFDPPLALPLVLPPGASTPVTLCLDAKEEGVFNDTLVLVNNCSPRSVAALQFQVAEDRRAPELTMNIDPCQTTAFVAFTDSLVTDRGLETVRVLETVNCTVTTDTSNLPKMLRLRVAVENSDFDAIFAVEATDYRGNTRYFRDTIQGFTLRFVPANRSEMVYNDETRRLIHCEPVTVYNYGLLPFVLSEAYLSQNIRFSAPLSQFPVVIPPSDSAGVMVCFNPREDELYRDTLVLSKYCRSMSLPLQGQGLLRDIYVLGDERCGISVSLSSEPPGEEILALYPNPADYSSTIQLGVRARTTVQLRISRITGAVVSASSAEFAPGMYHMALDLSRMEAGLYFCEVTMGTRRTVLPLHIVR